MVILKTQKQHGNWKSNYNKCICDIQDTQHLGMLIDDIFKMQISPSVSLSSSPPESIGSCEQVCPSWNRK